MRVAALLLSFAFAVSTAEAANLVPDPSFQQGVGGWANPPGTGFFWDAETGMFWDTTRSADGYGGSARLQMPFGLNQVSAALCVPVPGAGTYSWGLDALLPAGVERRASNLFWVDLWTGDSCSGSTVAVPGSGFSGLNFNTLAGGATPERWYGLIGRDLEVPASVHSAQLWLQLESPIEDGPFAFQVDDVYFGPRANLNGTPDIPMTDAAGSTLLFLALAAAGTLLLRRSG